MDACGLILEEEHVAEELVVIPALQDFNNLSAEDLASKSDVLVLKNKLVMREGEHNGVYYSWEELKNAMSTGEGAGLYYDHDDAAVNWVGDVKNLRADDSSKCLFGDLQIVDPVAAKKLRYGAKWGVSPTIDAEKLVKNGKKYALDPKFLSFSLVLRPAVRETMLNSTLSDERGSICMEEKEREMMELAQKKKQEDARDAELKDLRSTVENYKSEELSRKSSEVLELGKNFGILSDADLDKLKKMSDAGRAMLSEVINRVASTLKLGEEDDGDSDDEDKKEELKENYLKFRARFKKKNPKATEADVKKAFAKLSEDLAKKKKKDLYPYPEKEKMSEAQDRMKQELSDEAAGLNSLNTDMLDFMRKQESQ